MHLLTFRQCTTMEIKRDRYLKDLVSVRHNGLIKIITGLRRSGKSYLLFKIFSDWLIREGGTDAKHIIKIDLEDRRNSDLRNPDNLLNYIDSKFVDDRMHYILIDEVQLVKEFEDVLNSYLKIDNADVYVTGSNSRFLSADVITTFRGRGEEIRVFPLNFSEYLSAVSVSKEKALYDYMIYGGLPQVLTYDSIARKTSYLKSLFSQTYLKDIKERYKIVYDDAIADLLNILSSGIGSLTNPTKIKDTFESVANVKLSRTTIKEYIDYICDSFLIEKSLRYDIKGRKYIDSPYKVYFTDLGLRNAWLNFRQIEFTHIMENVIYNELRCRGFNVDVGVVKVQESDENDVRIRKQLEVDFICNRGFEKFYIQSAFRMPDEDKMKQEMASLIKIEDSFKKIIIVGEDCPKVIMENGITIIGIYDFLLNENSI